MDEFTHDLVITKRKPGDPPVQIQEGVSVWMALTQEDVFGLGGGIIFESDSQIRQHPTTTTYERGGRF